MFKNFRGFVFFFLAAGLAAFVPRTARAEADFGPLAADFHLTLESGQRTEALGPLFDAQHTDPESQQAMPPLWSDVRDTVADVNEFDFVYPLLTWNRYGTEYRFQILQVFNFTGGQTQQGPPTKRFTLFPVYFQQRSPDPSLDYTALFPIYGHLVGRPLGLRDDIRFVLFPLYSETRKRDVVTDNYLYPIFDVRRGDKLQGWQVWPLVGHETKELTFTTNLAGQAEPVGGHDNWFALWPIFFDNHTGLGTTNPAAEISVLPLYDRLRSPARDSTTYLWPFFNFVDDREKKYREKDLPWPFIEFARGEGKTNNRVWPFYGRGHDDVLEDDFWAWPIYIHHHLVSPPLDRDRTRICFFLYSDVKEKNLETHKSSRRVDLWPFFTWHRGFDGNRRLQILAPIEPVLPGNLHVERDWSPLWSLWRAERNGRTGASSESLLWNFYRQENRGGAGKCSLCFGFFQYQSGMAGWRWKLFYIPFGKGKAAPQFNPVPAGPPARTFGQIDHPRYDAVEGPQGVCLKALAKS
jgi:hypothetical protein